MSSTASRPIVVFGDDWGRHVSSLQHLFREIASRRGVVWVNAIGHRIPRLDGRDLRRAWEKGRAMLRPVVRSARSNGGPQDRRPFVVLNPRVLPWHDRSAVRTLNGWSLRRSIRNALSLVGSAGPPVVVTGSPPSFPVIGRLGEVASIYFCMDDFDHLPGVSQSMLSSLERRLLERVDAVVATARSLVRSKIPPSGRVFYLPQGVNYDHFARPRREPAELSGLPRPILGFAGGVSSCCDLTLLRRLATAHPHGSLVLVGPVTIDPIPLALSNVHLLGARPYRDLPAYVQRFDVALIPYLLNDWTRAVDPLKLLEYLAAGVPVVSMAIPEVQKYAAAIAIAGTRAEFLLETEKALAADRAGVKRRGQALARRHTWADRATQFLTLVDELVVGKDKPQAVTVPC